MELGGNMLGDAIPLGRLLYRFPDDLRSDRLIGALAIFRAREQVGLRSQPAPVCAQGLQQFLVQGDLAVNAALSTLLSNDQALTSGVKIVGRRLAHLGFLVLRKESLPMSQKKISSGVAHEVPAVC